MRLAFLLAFFLPLTSYAGVEDSIFHLYTGRSQATGFELNVDGHAYTITNDHVCKDAIKGAVFAVNEATGNKQLVHKIFSDPSLDVCIMTAVEHAPALEAGHNPKPGEHIHIVGHPMGGPLSDAKGDVTSDEEGTVMTNALVWPGNSGSPILEGGKVVGVVYGLVIADRTSIGSDIGAIEKLVRGLKKLEYPKCLEKACQSRK